MNAGHHQGTLRPGAHRALWIGAIAVAITAWIFSRAGTPFAGFDWLELIAFHKYHYRAALLSGQLPLWNPYVALGRPFLADIETATLYPPNLVFLLPAVWALPISVALHVALILAGACVLGRELALGGRASLLAGASFALSAALSGRLQAGQIQVFCTLSYLPLWWALAWRAWRAPAWPATSALAVATAGIALAGSPPFFWAMGWVVAAWLAAWAAGQPWRALWRGALAVAAGGAIGLALAAVQLVPFFELLQQGNRPRLNPEFVAWGSLPVRNLMSLLVPSTDALKFYWEMNLYAGVLAPLGLVAIVFVWRDREARAFAVTALCGLALALAPLGLTGWLGSWVPGMGALRLPARYAIAVGWSLVLVSILAWQRRGSPGALRVAWGMGMLQIGSLLWAVDRQSAHYAAAVPPAVETEIAARAAQLSGSAGPAPLRVALARDAVRSNAGVLHGFTNLNAFANPGLARVWDASHELAGVPPRTDNPALTAELALQPREALRRWGVQFGWDGPRRVFFFEPAACPLATAVSAAEFVPNAKEAAEHWWASPGGVVFLEGEAPAVSPWVRESHALLVTVYSATSVEVQWQSPDAGWLVLGEPWYPGWRARVEDTWIDTRPANGWMRAVAVQAGSRRVRFEFFPRSVWWGAAITLVAAIGLLAMLHRVRATKILPP